MSDATTDPFLKDCPECSGTYHVGEEDATDHDDDCRTRAAMINKGRWEDPDE